MARYTGAVCRLCRRENKKLFLKGERCYTDKCAVTRRATVPGQHGKARTRKASEYGVQLRAKQQARRYYGILESQFAKYFEMAAAKPGAMVQHCLPAYRGQEITDKLFEEHADEIFEEAENRLHAQKAVLVTVMK